MDHPHRTDRNEVLRQALLLSLEEEQAELEQKIRLYGPHAFPADFPDRILKKSKKASGIRRYIPALSGSIAAVLLLFLLAHPLLESGPLRQESISAPEAVSESESAMEALPEEIVPPEGRMEEEVCFSTEEVLNDSAAFEETLPADPFTSVVYENGTLCLSPAETPDLPDRAVLSLIRTEEPECLLSETEYSDPALLSFPLEKAPAPGQYQILYENETLYTFEWKNQPES